MGVVGLHATSGGRERVNGREGPVTTLVALVDEECRGHGILGCGLGSPEKRRGPLSPSNPFPGT